MSRPLAAPALGGDLMPRPAPHSAAAPTEPDK
eukprot:CAMPEP_0203993512 /NCGR_PEP_ID=MMETSP0360-20130528/10793_1 /ASSEMBLY_ACC=CAM_ASM_000342 /TAXON_ID=268821 /ORGANISM="Scrippsiella Hangoei, Strain SHTV-5" /LENGTH=31 /DNA_ID= /DNA_START= /DNA_END= /DNA_ORIENTATION=